MAQDVKIAAMEQLREGFRGQLIEPGDPEYDEARRVYNGMIDRRPRLIARCADVADVIGAVNLARESRLTLSVRGGSHNVTGFAVCDDGLVIDLSRLKGIRVDPKRRVVRAEGGCTWGDVDHATHAFGLATPGGVISTTGVGGLTLGGGIGYLARTYGLSCDNVISADVVTADGRFLTASAEENQDLYWALRGGGGNFGVVTSLEFRLHPVSTVYAGPVLWPLEKAREAMRFYRDYMAKAPDQMNAFFAFLIVPPGPPFPEHLHNKTMCGVVCCYTGSTEQAESVIKPVREFGPPALDLVGPMPFPALQGMFDPLLPPGLQHYWKADLFKDLSDEAIEEHLKFGPDVPSINSAVHLYPISGAAGRVGKNDTAFSYREAQYSLVIAAVYPDPADTAKNMQWVRDYWSALHPYSSGGAYVNFMMDEGEDRIMASYRDNYDRLVTVKKKYDPTNLFHMNQNINPNGAKG
ncbi:MAG TPA: FAD-binding oxidoreductase [Dehalococcoidia bacterium]|nr:FAD-binding oxidoreductase [Dehalococcoidia bacterium]